MKTVVTYAQNREDIILEWFFKGRKKGFYVDVGAANPDLDSVTKLFYKKGWAGINIEPIKHIYTYLQKRRPKDTNLNIGISSENGILSFREYASDGYSTFSTTMKEQYQDESEKTTRTYIDYEVPVQTLQSVLAKYAPASIQFLKVDVEGYEYEVLASNDWKKFRPELVCIEANHVNQDWRPLLKKHNYTFVYHDGLNEYYVAQESSLPKEFSYIDAIINREPIIKEEVARDLRFYKNHIADQKAHIAHLEYLLNEANHEIERKRTLPKHIATSGRRTAGSLHKKIRGRKT